MYILLAVCIVILVVLIYYTRAGQRLTPVRQFRAPGPVREWHVVGSYENRLAAANLLARTNSVMIEFMRGLKKKYHVGETDDTIEAEGQIHAVAVAAPNDTHNMIVHLLTNYDPDAFYENDPRSSPDTSFTNNKGESMAICLRNRGDPDHLVDEDILLFTMIHECAHIANYRYMGHKANFWEVFKWLLHEAELAGIYTPVDYRAHPVNFCGLRVAYQPLYDPTVRSIWI